MTDKCDHIIGMDDHYDELILQSKKAEYFDEYTGQESDCCVTLFNYCPFCGWKLAHD